MINTVEIEGNLLLEDEDEDSSVSSDASEPDRNIELNETAGQRILRLYEEEEEEEEIEVFTSNGSSTVPSKQSTIEENKSAVVINNTVEGNKPETTTSNSEDEFGIRYEKKNYPAWFDKNHPDIDALPIAAVVFAKEDVDTTDHPPPAAQAISTQRNTAPPQTDDDEDDEFAVVDTLPKSSNASNDPSVLQALENLKKQKDTASMEEINFQKELSEYAYNYVKHTPNQDLAEKALLNNKLYSNSFNVFGGNQTTFETSALSEEPLVIIDSQPMDFLLPDIHPTHPVKEKTKIDEEAFSKKGFMKDSKKALAEIVEVYGQGMGDQEVLLLDLMKEDEERGVRSLKGQGGGSKASEVRGTQKIAIDRSIKTITEEEDDDEDGWDDEKEVTIRQPGQRKSPNKQTKPTDVSSAEEEWNAVMVNQPVSSSNASGATSTQILNERTNLAHDNLFQDKNEDFEKWSYGALVNYLQSLDLSAHEPYIVVSEKSPHQSKGFLKSVFSSSSPSTIPLQFPNAENSLKFPFLLAQINYDPFDLKHLNMLRTIYYSLLEGKSTSSSVSHDILSPIDEKWENLGFQGKDPRTDLNRAIKLLSLVQMIAFIESNHSLVKYLFEISQSAQTLELQMNKKVSRGSKDMIDYSWPFMCVSILLSKEAIQCLRYGELNEICNKKRNVLDVLNLFHHACFAEFGRMLIEDPAKHHAMHLATLREKCAKNPGKILKAYNENNDAIIDSILSNDYYTKIQQLQQSPPQSQSSPVVSNKSNKSNTSKLSKSREEPVEEFAKFEEIADDPGYVNIDADKELAKSKNAKKFMI